MQKCEEEAQFTGSFNRASCALFREERIVSVLGEGAVEKIPTVENLSTLTVFHGHVYAFFTLQSHALFKPVYCSNFCVNNINRTCTGVVFLPSML